MANGFSTRRIDSEVMDDLALGDSDLLPALTGLRRLNRCFSPHSYVWSMIRRLRRPGSRPLRILDIATGSGDFPRTAARLARRDAVAVEIVALDMNPRTIAEARRLTAASDPIRYEIANVFDDRVDFRGYDVVTLHLFLHHLDDDDAVSLLRRLCEAGVRAGIVSELLRSRVAHAATWAAARSLSRSWVVGSDATASVRAGFRRQELESIADAAGLPGSSVRSRFPFRLILTWGTQR